MTEQRNTLAVLIPSCWKDDAGREPFIADARAVLTEHGIEPPPTWT